MICPAGTVVDVALAWAAVRLTACSAAWAWAKEYAWGMGGTVTGACPLEGTRVMVDPYGALVGFGVAPCDQRISWPLGTVLSYRSGAHDAFRWAAWRAAVAWAHVIPVSDGTVTGGGPSDGTTERVEPSLSVVPALGLCDRTNPAPTVFDLTPGAMCNVKWSLAAAVLA